MNEVITIRPVREEDMPMLVKNAEADKHAGVYLPTHVSVKHTKDENGQSVEEIVGYLSIGVFPTILCWQHSEKVGPIDSMRILGFLEGALCNSKAICIPCDPESPYNKLLPKAGYIEYTKQVKLYIKVQ